MVWIKIVKFGQFWIGHFGVLSGVLQSNDKRASPINRTCNLDDLMWILCNTDYVSSPFSLAVSTFVLKLRCEYLAIHYIYFTDKLVVIAWIFYYQYIATFILKLRLIA